MLRSIGKQSGESGMCVFEVKMVYPVATIFPFLPWTLNMVTFQRYEKWWKVVWICGTQVLKEIVVNWRCCIVKTAVHGLNLVKFSKISKWHIWQCAIIISNFHCIFASFMPCLLYFCKMFTDSSEHICLLLWFPSVLWRCWLGSRKGIQPVKNWVVGCWRGYLSGERCRRAYGPADSTANHCLLLQ